MSAIIYLLQVSACLALFYGFYYLMLNRLTFFTINRYYLLFALVFSFIIPLLTIPVHEQYSNVPVMQQVVNMRSVQNTPVANAVNMATTTSTPITWMQVLKWGYLIAVAALFTHLLITLINFFLKLKFRKVSSLGNVHILRGDKTLPNGSFLNYIFLNDNELSTDEMEQIIAHEMLHVKLFHSADRILMKIVQIVLCFNPLVYLYARSMEENHEFEVDREIARSTDKTQYADLLLHLSVANQGMLYHSFSKVPLKKRITMLFNKPSAKVKRVVYVLVLPVLVISCLAFARLKTDDTKPISVIYGINDLGKNPLVLINNKQYPSSILYEISERGIQSTRVITDNAVKMYGPKAKDGVVIIQTNDGTINYITAIEKDNLYKERSIPKSRYYTHITLKENNGDLYDKLIFHYSTGGSSSTTVVHGAKIGFLINGKYFTEDNINKVPRKTVEFSNGTVSYGLPTPKEKAMGMTWMVRFTPDNKTKQSSNPSLKAINHIPAAVAKLDTGNQAPFFTRVILKKENGERFERVTLTRDGRWWGYGDMPLGGKFGLMLSGKIYSEKDIKNFSPEFIDLLRHQKGISVREAQNESEKENLKGNDVLISIMGNIPEPNTYNRSN